MIRGQDNHGDEAVVAIVAQVAAKEGSSLCTGHAHRAEGGSRGALRGPSGMLGGGATFTVMSDWNLADGDVPPPMQHAVKGVHWDSAFEHGDIAAATGTIAVVKLEEAMKVKPLEWSDQAFPSRSLGALCASSAMASRAASAPRGLASSGWR